MVPIIHEARVLSKNKQYCFSMQSVGEPQSKNNTLNIHIHQHNIIEDSSNVLCCDFLQYVFFLNTPQHKFIFQYFSLLADHLKITSILRYVCIVEPWEREEEKSQSEDAKFVQCCYIQSILVLSNAIVIRSLHHQRGTSKP